MYAKVPAPSQAPQQANLGVRTWNSSRNHDPMLRELSPPLPQTQETYRHLIINMITPTGYSIEVNRTL